MASCQHTLEHTWVPSSSGSPLPPDAVIGGHDYDGAVIYVGRARYQDGYLPAKVIHSKNYVAVGSFNKEYPMTDYEVLVGKDYNWMAGANGGVPPNAVSSGGNPGTGEPLYVGRGRHANTLTVGKVHPSHGNLFIPFGGQEVALPSYEVLVGGSHQQQQEEDVWVAASSSHIPAGAVLAGHDSDLSSIYAGRAMHEGEMLPAKVVTGKGAYVSFDGFEFQKTSYEVLTGSGYVWAQGGDQLPPRAVSTGSASNGEPNYFGRGHYEGSLTPGVVSVEERSLFIPYGGREIRLSSYEVLCRL